MIFNLRRCSGKSDSKAQTREMGAIEPIPDKIGEVSFRRSL
jgi:hypothetical protein